MRTYILVTPARNEAKYLPALIESVCRQEIRPLKWVIVSDGSTDGTDEVALLAAKEHNFVELIKGPVGAERSFGSKAAAFNVGYARVAELSFDYIGNLDADVTFGSDY